MIRCNILLLCATLLTSFFRLIYNSAYPINLPCTNQKGDCKMSSYKCIIIDDEPLICRLIHKLGDWSEFDIEISAICYDGESALEEISRHKPDIVLSDIRVPIYNGIEIMERAQEAGLHPLFIILSGYSEFEYAQRAIQLKAVDYLVKPIRKDKLNDALRRCCDLLAAATERHAAAEALADAHKDLLWNDLCSKRYFCQDAEDFEAKYGTGWTRKTHYAAAVSISRPQLMEQRALYIDRVLSIFSAMFDKSAFSCDSSLGCIYLLFSMDENSGSGADIFQKLYVDIKHLEDTLGAFSLTIGYSDAFILPYNLPEHLEQAQHASDYRFERGADTIYSFSELPGGCLSYKELITETLTNNIIYNSGTLDMEQLKISIRGLETDFLRSSDRDFSGLIDLGIFILNTVMTAAHFPEQEVLRERFLYDYRFCVTYNDFFQLLTRYSCDILEQKKEAGHVELSSSVQSAKDYINKHYSEKIYLDDLAKSVCLSANYLSSIFKKELGTGITEYINTVRCSAAKELLKTTVLSLNAIAEKTGYADEKYFQHQFKKIVGITPAQFRRIYS